MPEQSKNLNTMIICLITSYMIYYVWNSIKIAFCFLTLWVSVLKEYSRSNWLFSILYVTISVRIADVVMLSFIFNIHCSKYNIFENFQYWYAAAWLGLLSLLSLMTLVYKLFLVHSLFTKWSIWWNV